MQCDSKKNSVNRCVFLDRGTLIFDRNGRIFPCINWHRYPGGGTADHIQGNKYMLWHDIAERVNWEIVAKRIQTIQDENNAPDKKPLCSWCPLLKKISLTDEPGCASMSAPIINFAVELGHYKKCNLRCSYCRLTQDGLHRNEVPSILTAMTDLVESGILSSDAVIKLCGGEPSLLPELPELLQLFEAHGNPVRFASNCVVFSPLIYDYLRRASSLEAFIVTSIDCGTAKTFAHIRGADAYEKVCENIRKYAEARFPDGHSRLSLKYIITLENQNTEDFLGFIELVKTVNPFRVELVVDQNITQKLFELSSKVIDECAENVIRFISLMQDNDIQPYVDAFSIKTLGLPLAPGRQIERGKMQKALGYDRKLGRVLGNLDNIALLSLDVFDTLLFRLTGTPEQVFDLVGQVLADEGLLLNDLPASGFRDLRVLAQAGAYGNLPSGVADPGLADIYVRLGNVVADIDRAIEIELAVEASLCQINPGILDLARDLRGRGAKVALVSDTYFNEVELAAILSANGLEPGRDYDLLLASRDRGTGKRFVGLYEVLLGAFPDIPRDRVLHIGDNPASDVANPKRIGIRSVHYPTTVANKCAREIHEDIYGEPVPERLRGLRRLAAAQAPTGEMRFWFEFGATVLGPVFVAFADWVIERCARKNIRRLLAVMRDGHIIAPLLHDAAIKAGYDCTIVEAWMSRQSTYFSGFESARDGNVGEWMNTTIDLASLFERFSLELPVALAGFAGEPVNSLRFRVGDDGRMVRDEIMAALQAGDGDISAALDRERCLLLDYFDALRDGFHDVALVDHSHNATIGTSLARALALAGREAAIHNFISEGNADTIGPFLLQGHRIECFLGGNGSNQALLRRLVGGHAIFEELFYGDTGSTVGYRRRSDGKVEPLLADKTDDIRLAAWRKATQRGILAYSRLWHGLDGDPAWVGREVVASREALCGLLTRVIELPTREEAEYLGNIRIDVGYGGKVSMPAVASGAQAVIGSAGSDECLRRGAKFASQDATYWHQGALARHRLAALMRAYLARVRPGDDLFTRFYLLAMALLGEGIGRLMIHGAGEAGAVAYAALRAAGAEVVAASDRNEAIHGRKLGDVTVGPFMAGLAAEPGAIVIGSVAFIDEIRAYLTQALAAGGKDLPVRDCLDLSSPDQ